MNTERRTLTLLLPFLIPALLGTSCSRPERVGHACVTLDPNTIDGDRAFAETAALAEIYPRHSGTEGARNAAEHINRRLEEMGLESIVETFEDNTPSGVMTFRNVIAHVQGEGAGLIVLASHYDTKRDMPPEFRGANDSGSSSGLLMELARAIRQSPAIRPTILIAFLDGEECARTYGQKDGLHGSRHLAAQLIRTDRHRQTLAVIVLDMVGDRDLTVTIPRNGTPRLIAAVFESAREESARHMFSLTDPILDDHVPFLLPGMPAVDIIDFQYGSAPGKNDYWHTTEDTMDKISPESLQIVGRVVVRTINSLLSPTS